MNVLAISGSLRRGAYSSALVRAAAEVAAPGTVVQPFEGLAEIPPYDADADAAGEPAPVAAIRDAVLRADAVLFATPEYNGSVPGVLKNAVDWLSRPRGAAALAGKPVTVIGASPGQYGALWAQTDLRRILGVAGARAIGDELPIARVHELVDEGGALTDERTRGRIAGQVAALVDEAASVPRAA
jgi:chromate reductase, NAD(P)H dehydrogenase (quinone)